MIYHNTYMYNINDKTFNINLMDVMKPELRDVHRYAKCKLKIDMSQLFHIKIFSNDGFLNNMDFNTDYDTMTIKIDNYNSDIIVMLYMNRLLYETIITAMATDKNFFTSKFLTMMLVKIGQDALNVQVNRFVNDRELQSSDILKSLRIQTQYGPGYIQLLDDADKDAYKICLGYNADGTPIIKRLKTQK